MQEVWPEILGSVFVAYSAKLRKEYDELVDQYYLCTTKLEVETLTKTIDVHKKALSDVALNLRQATSDLTKAIKDFEKNGAKAVKPNADNKKPSNPHVAHALVNIIADANGCRVEVGDPPHLVVTFGASSAAMLPSRQSI